MPVLCAIFVLLFAKQKCLLIERKIKKVPGSKAKGVCGGGERGKGAGGRRSGAGGPRWGCGWGDRPEGLPHFLGELQGESFFVQREERLEPWSPLKGTLVLRPRSARSPGKSELERASSLGGTRLGGLPAGAPGAGLHFHAFSEALRARDVFLINF